MSVFRGNPEDMCSGRVFRILTPSGNRARSFDGMTVTKDCGSANSVQDCTIIFQLRSMRRQEVAMSKSIAALIAGPRASVYHRQLSHCERFIRSPGQREQDRSWHRGDNNAHLLPAPVKSAIRSLNQDSASLRVLLSGANLVRLSKIVFPCRSAASASSRSLLWP